jgi:hypothetical protein
VEPRSFDTNRRWDMGFLGDIGKSAKNVDQMYQQSQQMQAEQDAIQAGAGYDTSDPAFAPIEGVDCDTYARVMGGLGRNMVMGPENVEKYATENGVPQGKWQEVQLGWTGRMQQYPQVMQRIGVLMSQATMG